MRAEASKILNFAVIGAGEFGRNHLRVLHELPGARLVAVVDTVDARAQGAARQYGCIALRDISELRGKVDAAVVAVPTSAHASVGCALLEAGIDVLVEKPIAADLAEAARLIETAERHARILQVGHLERFNPAIEALTAIVNMPLFFEIHRLNMFSPRSLDVDVVLDLMIHDIDILLALVGKMPEEIRAAGIAILSPKVDITNVRLAFAGGCVANLTASRVSTERVRKLRLFQPHQYISLDYHRQDAVSFTVAGDREIGFSQLPVAKGEPLRRELESFITCVEQRTEPRVGGKQAMAALEVCLAILDKIEEHLETVRRSLAEQKATSAPLPSS